MATFAFTAGEEFSLKISSLETDVEEIAKKAIYAGAKVVADRMRVNLQSVISDTTATQLVGALGITPIKRTVYGWDTKIGFDGYDTEGVAFQLIARAMESGTSTSTRKKRPFVRRTINQTKAEVKEVMDRVIEEEFKKMFG